MASEHDLANRGVVSVAADLKSAEGRDLVLTLVAGVTYVQGDVDGDGASDITIVVDGDRTDPGGYQL